MDFGQTTPGTGSGSTPDTTHIFQGSGPAPSGSGPYGSGPYGLGPYGSGAYGSGA